MAAFSVMAGVLPVFLARSSEAVAALPVLDVFQGPFALAWLVAGGLLAALELLHLPRLAAPAPLLLAAGLLATGGAGFVYATSLRPFGDEPHYLVMAQSLARERDLDLADNYQREDFREYTPGPLAPHYGAPRADGRPFPAHSVGLPLLLAPVYAAGGRLACVLVLATLAATLAQQTFLLARRLLDDLEAAFVAWALALGPPVFFYGFHVYTEVPTALAVVVALRLLLQPSPPPVQAALAATAVSALPWLHVKAIPMAAALGVVALVRLSGGARLVFTGVALAAALLFLGYYAAIFGTASPLSLYGGVPRDAAAFQPLAVPGLLFDRSFGLLPVAPAFLVALAGAGSLARQSPRAARDLALVAAAVVAPLLVWRMWWGGQCPPARFLVPLAPLLAVAAAARVRERGSGLARWTAPLALTGLAVGFYAALRPEALLLVNRGDRPTRLWAAVAGDSPLPRYLPSLVAATPEDLRIVGVWGFVAAGLLVLDGLSRRRAWADTPFRSLLFPLALVLGAGTAIDRWALR